MASAPTGQPSSQPTLNCYIDGFNIFGELIGISLGVFLLEIAVFTTMRQNGIFYDYTRTLSDSSYYNIKELNYYKRKSLTRESSARLGRPDSMRSTHSHDDKRSCSCCCCCCYVKEIDSGGGTGQCFYDLPDEPYGPHYFAILAYKSTFMYCSDIWFPGGKLGRSRFPRGFVEDYFLYLFNNHSLFSLVMSVRGHPFSTSERMLGCFLQNSIVFFQTGFLSFLNFSLISRYIYKLLIAPIALIGRKVFYLAMGCQCIAEHEKDGYVYAKTLACLGRVVAAIFFFIAIGLIVAGSSLASNAYADCITDKYDSIGQTALTFLVVSSLLDIISSAFRFLNGRVAVEITFCCCCTYKGLGRWFAEKIIFFGLEKGTDYGDFVLNLLLLKILIMWEMNGSADRCTYVASEASDDSRVTEFIKNPLARRNLEDVEIAPSRPLRPPPPQRTPLYVEAN